MPSIYGNYDLKSALNGLYLLKRKHGLKIQSGEIVGKYKIGEVLGQGGMATVYKAIQQPLGRNVALKVLHQHLTIEKMVRERFLLEAQAIASMKHPNIVQVYDYEASEEVSFISMEYIDGGALDQQLKAREIDENRFTPLPIKQALDIARDIAEALDYAHKFGIVHRDVKPANILIGTDGRYVLTDFGIATLLHQNRMTADGATSGTPTYIPPEMITGDRGDERSDIYSLGIVLFQLLTGELPFNSENLYGILMKHINEPIPPLQQFNANIDDDVSDIVHRAVQKNAEDRYQTGQELSDAIQAVLSQPKYQTGQYVAEDEDALIVQDLHGESGTSWVEVTRLRVTGWFKWLYQFSQLNWKLQLGSAFLIFFLLVSPLLLFIIRGVRNPDEVPEGPVILEPMKIEDQFDNNDNGWPTGGAPRWIQLVDGVYEMRIEESNQVISSIPFNVPNYNTFEYSADVLQKDGPPETGYGLVFNYNNSLDYLVLGINGFGQWSIWNLNEGVWEAQQISPDGNTWIYSEFINPPSEWNNLKVEMRDGEMDLFVNNQFLVRIPRTSDMNAEGQIGFYLATSRDANIQPSIVEFDNVVINPQ